MKKYMILLIYKKYFFKYIKDDNIHELYKEKNFVQKYSRKLATKVNFPFLSIFLGKWKKKIKETEVIIIMDNGYKSQITKYIKKLNSKIKIVFYYWNIINDENKKALEDKNIDEFWSFDMQDSNKYGLKYFPQFYEKCYEENDETIKNDVIYLGAAKDREKIITYIEEKLKKMKLSTNIIISHKGDCLLTYDDYLKLIKTSKCILDIVGKSQKGLTLRALEAMYYSKKLITNNTNIVNYEFYNSNNIFILKDDNYRLIKEFLDKPYEKIEQIILNKYSYDNWKKTLIDGEKNGKEI